MTFACQNTGWAIAPHHMRRTAETNDFVFWRGPPRSRRSPFPGLAAPAVASGPAKGGMAFGESCKDARVGPRGISNNKAPKTTSIGTLQPNDSSSLCPWASNPYGGADNSNAAAAGTRPGTSGPVTLHLFQPTQCFGPRGSAIDPNSGIRLCSADPFPLRVTGADADALFGLAPTLAAPNAMTHLRPDYPGKPGTNPPQNPVQYSALTIVRIPGSAFTRIVFDRSDANTTGFETDNPRIRVGDLAIPGTAVLRTNQQIQPVSEPSFRIAAAAGLFRLARVRPGRTD